MSYKTLAMDVFSTVYEGELVSSEKAQKDLCYLALVIEWIYIKVGWMGVDFIQTLYKNAQFEEGAELLWQDYVNHILKQERHKRKTIIRMFVVEAWDKYKEYKSKVFEEMTETEECVDDALMALTDELED